MPVIIKFKNVSNNEEPKYADEGSSGMDIRAWLEENVILMPGERKLIHTGISVDIPTGYELQVRSRSGLTLKKGLVVANSPGTIDSSYTGEIGIILYNIGKIPQLIKSGERIAQLVLSKVEVAKLEEIDEINKTSLRGDGGFGHTGTK